MNKSLQYLFIESKGRPLEISGIGKIYQIDEIKVDFSKIKISFAEGNSTVTCGISLKLYNGYFNIGCNKKVSHLYIWDDKGLSKTITYDITSLSNLNAILKVWNIYRIHHKSGLITEDQFTNNAGMLIESNSTNQKIYHCSDGIGKFDLENQVFKVELDRKSVV